MVLNLTKRQIMTFRGEMYAFFYKNGPTLISQHSVRMENSSSSKEVFNQLISFKALFKIENLNKFFSKYNQKI